MNLSECLLFNSQPLQVLGEARCLEKATTESHAPRSVLPALENKSWGPHTLKDKYSESHILSSPIQSLLHSLIHSTTTYYLNRHFMPSILTYSITHFNFLPSWSLHSSAYFLLRDHEDQPHHTLHPCFPATTRSANPLGHPSSPGLLLLSCSMYPLIWSIYHPSQPSQTLFHSTIPSYHSTPFLQSFQTEVPFLSHPICL